MVAAHASTKPEMDDGVPRNKEGEAEIRNGDDELAAGNITCRVFFAGEKNKSVDSPRVEYSATKVI